MLSTADLRILGAWNHFALLIKIHLILEKQFDATP